MYPDLPEIYWAYLAGFVDGEGCISVYGWKNKKQKSYRPKLRIAQTDQVVMLELHERFGKVGYFRIDRHERAHWQFLSREDLRWALTNLLPHLLLKRGQAEVALKLLDDKSDKSLAKELSAMKNHRKVGS